MEEKKLTDWEARTLRTLLQGPIAAARFADDHVEWRSLAMKGLVVWKSDVTDVLEFWQLAIPEDEARRLIAVALLERPDEDRAIFKGLVRWSELLQAWRLAVSKDEAIAAMAVAVLEQPEVDFQESAFPLVK